MLTDKLLLNFVNKDSHPREKGRYWATDIYPIIKGYLKPKDFFTHKEIDLQGSRNIISGEAYENQWKEILDVNKIEYKYGNEIKKEIKIDNIVLVVKPDFEMKEWVLETKYPTKPTNEIPEKWKYQLECESQATKKKVYLGIFEYPFNIKYLEYKPSKERWEKIKEVLVEFDKKLQKIAE